MSHFAPKLCEYVMYPSPTFRGVSYDKSVVWQADLQVVLEELDTVKKGGLEFQDFVRLMTR
jgi:hypothetical protein